MKIKILQLFLVTAFLVNQGFGQAPSIKVSTQDDIKADIALVPCKMPERLEGVKNLFKKMGAVDNEIKVEKTKDIENLIVTKKGKSDETIIIGAHYDKVKDGCGAIDNWTGIVVIANIYRTMRDLETEKTYLFIAFDKEEEGLYGSAAFAKAIPKEERPKYCSMVNIDSFGLAYPQILENTSSPKMSELAESLAKELKLPFQRITVANADADSSSFKDKDIPAVTFSGLTSNWATILHSSNDKVENIKIPSVYIGYQFVLRYITKLDAERCGIFKKPEK